MVLGWGKKSVARQETEEELSMEEILASIRKYVSEDPKEHKKNLSQDHGDDYDHSPSEVFSATDGALKENQLNPDFIPDFFSASTPLPSFEPRHDFDVKEEQSTDYVSEYQQIAMEPSSSLYDKMNDEIEKNYTFHKKEDFSAKNQSFSSPHSTASQKESSLHTPEYNNQNSETYSASAPQNLYNNEQHPQEGRYTVSNSTTSMASKSFSKLIDISRLSATAQEESHASLESGLAGTSGTSLTLDTLISDLARPLIQTWIDQHLPTIVEKMVSEEIERITEQLGLKKK